MEIGADSFGAVISDPSAGIKLTAVKRMLRRIHRRAMRHGFSPAAIPSVLTEKSVHLRER